jgi:beta-lactam-binding protein with PASTA domain
VTITVARAQQPGKVGVPNVIGMRQGEATDVLQAAGFDVSVVREPECDPSQPGCAPVPGLVWAQSPTGTAEAGSTVTIKVNP